LKSRRLCIIVLPLRSFSQNFRTTTLNFVNAFSPAMCPSTTAFLFHYEPSYEGRWNSAKAVCGDRKLGIFNYILNSFNDLLIHIWNISLGWDRSVSVIMILILTFTFHLDRNRWGIGLSWTGSWQRLWLPHGFSRGLPWRRQKPLGRPPRRTCKREGEHPCHTNLIRLQHLNSYISYPDSISCKRISPLTVSWLCLMHAFHSTGITVSWRRFVPYFIQLGKLHNWGFFHRRHRGHLVLESTCETCHTWQSRYGRLWPHGDWL